MFKIPLYNYWIFSFSFPTRISTFFLLSNSNSLTICVYITPIIFDSSIEVFQLSFLMQKQKKKSFFLQNKYEVRFCAHEWSWKITIDLALNAFGISDNFNLAFLFRFESMYNRICLCRRSLCGEQAFGKSEQRCNHRRHRRLQWNHCSCAWSRPFVSWLSLSQWRFNKISC